MRGIVRNVDESRGAELAASADLDTPPLPMSGFNSFLLQSSGLGSLWYPCFRVLVDLVFSGCSVISQMLQLTPVSTRAGC